MFALCSIPRISVAIEAPRNLRIAELEIATPQALSAAVGSPYDVTLTATGGIPPYTWGITSGGLPPAVTLSTATGQIAGTPTATGDFTFTVQVQDSNQTMKDKSLTLSVGAERFDRYGGRLDVSCTPTGFFHTEKIGNRWWLCTPEGHGFFKTGLIQIQPSGRYDVNGRYGSSPAWAEKALQRVKGWGFNTVDVVHSTYVEATSSVATKMPFVPMTMPEYYAMMNSPQYTMDMYSQPLLNHAVKSLFNAMPAAFYNSRVYNTRMPDLFDSGTYDFTERFLAHQTVWKGYATNANRSYIIGVVLGEIDNLYPLESGDMDGANPNPSEHLSWVVLGGSPVQTAGALFDKYRAIDQSGGTPTQFYYPDTEVKSKTKLREFLAARYGTIQALNAAWGSSYTTFGSSGVQVTGEPVATADGRSGGYDHTLAHRTPSRFSLQVLVNGTVVAGELHRDDGDGTASPGIVTSGRIWGPYVTGTVTYATGAISPTFKTVTGIKRTFAQISTDGSTVTTHTMYQHGLWQGARVTIAGTPSGNYDGTYTVVSVADPFHFTFAKAGSYPATAAGNYALAAVPGEGDAISVNYVFNGWEIGTGLMDEANNHAWSNTDATTRFVSRLPSVSMRNDLNGFLEEIAYHYFNTSKQKVNEALPDVMFLGPGAVSTHGWPSRAPILRALVRADLPILMTTYGLPFSQAALDYASSYVGDRPLAYGYYATANADSPWAGFPEYYINYPTQGAKGEAYSGVMNSLLNTATNGSYPYIGMTIWGYYDSENKNWGLTTSNDNAYDGHEAVSRTVPCSPPLQTLTCGGEAGDYGDVITKIREANVLWQSVR